MALPTLSRMATGAGFTALRVPSHVLMMLARMEITKPTPVQHATLEALMPRPPHELPPSRTAVIHWPTGSGKTLAFALPMLARLDVHALGQGVQGLVVAPTRELTVQTARTLRALTGHRRPNSKGHAIKVSTLLGTRSERMESELRHKPPDLIVGTPRLLAELFKRDRIPMLPDASSRTLVLDEVGALTLQHSWPSVEGVLRRACGSRGAGTQYKGALYLASADVPSRSVAQCVAAAGADPDAVCVLEPPSRERMPSGVRHAAIRIPALSKASADSATELARAVERLVGRRSRRGGGALVFVPSAGEAYVLSDELRRRRLSVGMIHSDDSNAALDREGGRPRKPRQARQEALDALARGELHALVATDMLAHGIDVKGARYVLNANTPDSAASYLHRAGRVGRTGGGAGAVLSFPRSDGDAEVLTAYAEELGFELDHLELEDFL